MAYGCVIVAALAFTAGQLAGTARATGGSNVLVTSGDCTLVVDASGQTWERDPNTIQWSPIGPSFGSRAQDGVMLHRDAVGIEMITRDGHLVTARIDYGSVVDYGSIFTGTVLVQPTTWGSLKAQFGR